MPMKIRQPVINTFERCNIPYKMILTLKGTRKATNRFTGESVETSPLMAYLVEWVYATSNQFEIGNPNNVRISDFDRIRYFILAEAPDVYNICID